MEDDSIAGIYSTLTDCAPISQMAGGIGLHIRNIRASGSYIRGTNGTSNGIIPMLVYLTELRDIMIKVVVKEKVLSQFILSHGMGY